MSSRTIARWCQVAAVGLPVIAVVGCSSAGREAPTVFTRNEWTSPTGVQGTQIVTDHYDLRVTSLDAPLRERLPGFMEAAFRGYAATIRPSRESPDRMVVYLFGTRPEWVDFTKITFPAQAYTYLHLHAGGYTDQASGMAVAHDLGRDRTLALLAHEGFHQYVARHLERSIPPWLNEGIACQWEAFSLDGDQPMFTPTKNYMRRNSLRSAISAKDAFIPLPKLLGMNAGDAVVETGQAVRSYYSEVWLLVLFLRHGADGKYAEGFSRLLADAGTDRLDAAVGAYRATTPDSARLSPGEIIFRHYITEDLDTCGDEFFTFARQMVY
jgi:hypothetical protein